MTPPEVDAPPVTSNLTRRRGRTRSAPQSPEKPSLTWRVCHGPGEIRQPIGGIEQSSDEPRGFRRRTWSDSGLEGSRATGGSPADAAELVPPLSVHSPCRVGPSLAYMPRRPQLPSNS